MTRLCQDWHQGLVEADQGQGHALDIGHDHDDQGPIEDHDQGEGQGPDTDLDHHQEGNPNHFHLLKESLDQECHLYQGLLRKENGQGPGIGSHGRVLVPGDAVGQDQEGGQGHHALIAEEVADLEDQGHTDQGLGEPVDQEEGRDHVKRDVPGHVRGEDQGHLLERRKNLDHGHYQYLSFDEQILSCLVHLVVVEVAVKVLLGNLPEGHGQEAAVKGIGVERKAEEVGQLQDVVDQGQGKGPDLEVVLDTG